MEDGFFDAGDAIVFGVDEPTSPYSADAIYWLVEGRSDDTQAAEVGVAEVRLDGRWELAATRTEERHYYQGDTDRADPWLWDLLAAPCEQDFLFELDGVPIEEQTLLSVALLPLMEDPTARHCVVFTLNGEEIEAVEWEGVGSRRIESSVPADLFAEGTNLLTVSLEGAGEAEMVYMDHIEAAYWREVSDLGMEVRSVAEISPAGDGVRSFEEEGADWIVLGPEEVLPGVEKLMKHREEQWMRVRAASIEDLYAAADYGHADPRAIKDFLHHAYENWEAPPPSFVLLVGTGQLDHLDNLGATKPNHVPPYMTAGRFMDSAWDGWYGCVKGDDPIPDVLIDRLPVETAEEAQNAVEKILQYEMSSRRGHKTVATSNAPDEERREVGRQGDSGVEANFSSGRVSSPPWIAQVPVEGESPVITMTSGLEGMFQGPFVKCLAEEMLTDPDEHAVAVWTPSALIREDEAEVFVREFEKKIEAHEAPAVAPAVLGALLHGLEVGPAGDGFTSYNLLGDPAFGAYMWSEGDMHPGADFAGGNSPFSFDEAMESHIHDDVLVGCAGDEQVQH